MTTITTNPSTNLAALPGRLSPSVGGVFPAADATGAFDILCRDIERGHVCICDNCQEREIVVMPDTVHKLWADGMRYYCSERCFCVHVADVRTLDEWRRTVRNTEADPFASSADIAIRQNAETAMERRMVTA